MNWKIILLKLPLSFCHLQFMKLEINLQNWYVLWKMKMWIFFTRRFADWTTLWQVSASLHFYHWNSNVTSPRECETLTYFLRVLESPTCFLVRFYAVSRSQVVKSCRGMFRKHFFLLRPLCEKLKCVRKNNNDMQILTLLK